MNMEIFRYFTNFRFIQLFQNLRLKRTFYKLAFFLHYIYAKVLWLKAFTQDLEEKKHDRFVNEAHPVSSR